MDRQRLTQMLSEGLSTRRIAAQLGISQTAVRYWVAKHALRPVGKPFLKFSDESLRSAVERSSSFSEVCRVIGASVAGSSHQHLKRRIQSLQLDTSHFDPWARNRRNSVEVPLTNDQTRTRRVRAEKLRESLQRIGTLVQCAVCGISDWQGKPLQLHVDHIDGDWRNNLPENLRYLCLNCHSQTDTWCKQKR